MDVATINQNIKKLAHDRGLSNTDLTLFINQAVAELRGKGYLFNDVQFDETVVIADGTSEITSVHPIKSVLRCSADYTADSGGIRLLSPTDGDTSIRITYISQIKDWDGTEAGNILDPWLYIYGATHYACAHRMSPETAYYRAMFDMQASRVFADSAFIDGGENAMSTEIIGI